MDEGQGVGAAADRHHLLIIVNIGAGEGRGSQPWQLPAGVDDAGGYSMVACGLWHVCVSGGLRREMAVVLTSEVVMMAGVLEVSGPIVVVADAVSRLMMAVVLERLTVL